MNKSVDLIGAQRQSRIDPDDEIIDFKIAEDFPPLRISHIMFNQILREIADALGLPATKGRGS
jgi:hypothetical protein